MMSYYTTTVPKKDKYNKRITLKEYPLFLLIVLTVINNHQFGVSLSGIIIPVLLCFAFMVLGKKKFTLNRTHGLVLLFWIMATISTLFSAYKMPQRDALTFLIFVVFFIAITSQSFERVQMIRINKVYLTVSIFVASNILWNFFIDNAYGWKRYSLYVLGTYRDPNYVSAFLLPAIVIIMLKVLLDKTLTKKHKLLLYTILFIIVAAILSTGSRAAFVVLFIIAVRIVFNYVRTYYSFKVFYRFLLIFVFFILSWIALKSILPQFIISRLLTFNQYTETSRIDLWGESIQFFLNNPILGSGMGSLRDYLFSIGGFDSHNMYLDILIGQGIIGIFILGLIFYRFINLRKRDKAIMVTLVFAFFGPLFFINGFNTASFWTPMILCEIFSSFSRRSTYGLTELFQGSIKTKQGLNLHGKN